MRSANKISEGGRCEKCQAILFNLQLIIQSKKVAQPYKAINNIGMDMKI